MRTARTALALCLLAIGFGARSSPASPPPPPANVEGWVLFFEHDSVVLAPQSAPALESIAAGYRNEKLKDEVIELASHTDRLGPRDYNKRLACRRGAAIRKFLVDNGATPRFVVAGYGEDRPLVATEDGVAEPNNRRVELVSLPSESNC